MENLFLDATRLFLEADDDPPAVDIDNMAPAEDPAPADDTSDTDGGDSPPDIGDLSSPSMDDGSGDVGDYQDDGGGAEDGSNGDGNEEDPNDLPMDEKGEIFAKINILSSYKYLYKRIGDTLSTIDKIDLVQIGNRIQSEEISELKQKLSLLMEDIYVTIVYEFQQQYSNLKVKLVEYSSRYVMLVKSLVSMIKKDQHV